jgi:hypothetical protein
MIQETHPAVLGESTPTIMRPADRQHNQGGGGRASAENRPRRIENIGQPSSHSRDQADYGAEHQCNRFGPSFRLSTRLGRCLGLNPKKHKLGNDAMM